MRGCGLYTRLHTPVMFAFLCLYLIWPFQHCMPHRKKVVNVILKLLFSSCFCRAFWLDARMIKSFGNILRQNSYTPVYVLICIYRNRPFCQPKSAIRNTFSLYKKLSTYLILSIN